MSSVGGLDWVAILTAAGIIVSVIVFATSSAQNRATVRLERERDGIERFVEAAAAVEPTIVGRVRQMWLDNSGILAARARLIGSFSRDQHAMRVWLDDFLRLKVGDFIAPPPEMLSAPDPTASLRTLSEQLLQWHSNELDTEDLIRMLYRDEIHESQLEDTVRDMVRPRRFWRRWARRIARRRLDRETGKVRIP